MSLSVEYPKYEHSPTLNTVIMVECVLKNMAESVKISYKKIFTRVSLLLSFILSANFVSAFDNPLEGALISIASFFNLQIFRESALQIGLIKFMLCIFLFSVLFWSGTQFVFKGPEGRRTAGIAALVISLIGVIFMPNNAIIGLGSMLAGTFFIILTFGITAIGVYIAFKKLTGSWYMNLLGMLLLILVTSLVTVVHVIMGVY